MSSVLCLDFGTSSIRAVIREASSLRKVLPIGQATPRQSIDGASIPSAFCIDADLETLRFGQHAHEAILADKNIAYAVTSPKRWLKEPKLLGQKVLPKLDITRRDVLIGLMGYALYAANETNLWTLPKNPYAADIRVAHPVWPTSIKEDADRALSQITWMAVNMAPAGDWGVTSHEILCSWTRPADDTEIIPELFGHIDTIEPIAAATELLPTTGNERRICMVVDVGAGTTDIGIFQNLSPDKSTNKGERIIPAGPATSVFKAGDEIDNIVLGLLQQKNREKFEKNQVRIRSEIRFQKESLFKNQRIQIAGIDLSVKEVEESREAQEMATSIRQGIQKCLTDAYTKIQSFSNTAGLANGITIIMAGGGADIHFLRKAIGQPISIYDSNFRFKFFNPNPPKINMHGAGYERLAVGLGGALESYEKVVHEHTQLVGFLSLGTAKQRVDKWI
jgi:hypothetical protein